MLDYAQIFERARIHLNRRATLRDSLYEWVDRVIAESDDGDELQDLFAMGAEILVGLRDHARKVIFEEELAEHLWL